MLFIWVQVCTIWSQQTPLSLSTSMAESGKGEEGRNSSTNLYVLPWPPSSPGCSSWGVATYTWNRNRSLAWFSSSHSGKSVLWSGQLFCLHLSNKSKGSQIIQSMLICTIDLEMPARSLVHIQLRISSWESIWWVKTTFHLCTHPQFPWSLSSLAVDVSESWAGSILFQRPSTNQKLEALGSLFYFGCLFFFTGLPCRKKLWNRKSGASGSKTSTRGPVTLTVYLCQQTCTPRFSSGVTPPTWPVTLVCLGERPRG